MMQRVFNVTFTLRYCTVTVPVYPAPDEPELDSDTLATYAAAIAADDGLDVGGAESVDVEGGPA